MVSMYSKNTSVTTLVNDVCSIACGEDVMCCVCTGHKNGDVKLWSLSKGDSLVISQVLRGMSSEIQSIQCDAITGLVCAASSSRLCIWDTSFCTSRLCGDEKKERGTYAGARCEASLELESKQCAWIHTKHGSTYLAVSNRDGLNLFAPSRRGWSLICTYNPADEVATMHNVRKRRRVEEEEEESVSKNIGMSVTDFCAMTGNVIAVFVHVDNSEAMEIHHVRVVEDSNQQQHGASISNSILEATRAGRCDLTTKILESLHRTFTSRERRKTEDDMLRFNTTNKSNVTQSVEIDVSVAEKLRQIRKRVGQCPPPRGGEKMFLMLLQRTMMYLIFRDFVMLLRLRPQMRLSYLKYVRSHLFPRARTTRRKPRFGFNLHVRCIFVLKFRNEFKVIIMGWSRRRCWRVRN